MDDEDRRILEELRAAERRADYTYAGVLIAGLVVVIIVTVLALA
jgi:hypothetical protein